MAKYKTYLGAHELFSVLISFHITFFKLKIFQNKIF